MSKAVKATKTKEDGLHFKAKVAGSPFGTSTNSYNPSKSCFLCGKHRPQTELTMRKLVGKYHAVCSPKC
jgi:hypothetical protein